MSAVGLHWRLSDSPPCAPAKINQAETLHLPHLNRKYVSYIRQEPSCVDMKSWKNISYNSLICWAISDSERDTTALYDSSVHQLTSFPAGKDATFHRVFFIYFLVWHNCLLCTDGSMPFFFSFHHTNWLSWRLVDELTEIVECPKRSSSFIWIGNYVYGGKRRCIRCRLSLHDSGRHSLWERHAVSTLQIHLPFPPFFLFKLFFLFHFP